MNSSSQRSFVTTSHGRIAVEEQGHDGLPVLLIHGNSSCRGVFRKQLQSALAHGRRLIAFDLPGHGGSDNAPDPIRSYTRPSIADAAVELLAQLQVSEAVVVGWSLGGHIAIDMIARFPGLRGLMIIGTPPVGRDNMAAGFTGLPHARAASREQLSDAEIDDFVAAIFGASAEPFLRDAVVRTDGRFRSRLFEAIRTEADYTDQRVTVKESRVPLAVVNGDTDRIVKLDYLDTLSYGNLWEGRCHRLPGLGHASFWEDPTQFNPLLDRFLRDIESGR
ncbi:alpha/beta fold hydrolase [Paraburkholderia solisilvae]|uniref:Arylesterase n=1 Tax=Paraburkholderia solisilvae TaxID=624376 RepID=A0A6J5DB88_9BURK|nr:Arylesterase [Paraburkholderia solisilvae]